MSDHPPTESSLSQDYFDFLMKSAPLLRGRRFAVWHSDHTITDLFHLDTLNTMLAQGIVRFQPFSRVYRSGGDWTDPDMVPGLYLHPACNHHYTLAPGPPLWFHRPTWRRYAPHLLLAGLLLPFHSGLCTLAALLCILLDRFNHTVSVYPDRLVQSGWCLAPFYTITFFAGLRNMTRHGSDLRFFSSPFHAMTLRGVPDPDRAIHALFGLRGYWVRSYAQIIAQRDGVPSRTRDNVKSFLLKWWRSVF